MQKQRQVFEETRPVPGEVLILFKNGLGTEERELFLHRLFSREYDLGRMLRVQEDLITKRPIMTDDGFGLVLAVPHGWEEFYVAMLRSEPQLQFAQRRHQVRPIEAKPAGH
jgi:hypothetical protein